MRRILGIATIVLGVLALVGAGGVHWVLEPRMAQLPSDQSTLRIYQGTATAVANPTVTTGTRVGPGLLRDVPVTVQHFTKVVDTRGAHEALVRDQRVLTIPGYTIANLLARWDIDRRTFLPRHGYAAATQARGLTFNWPLSTKTHDYTGWVSDTGRTTRLVYDGSAERGGISTYVFHTKTRDARIVDPQILRLLPASMTKAQLLELTPSLQMTKSQLLQLNELVATLPDPVPLTYTYRVTARFWVAPTTGVVVDHAQHEVRTLSFVTSKGPVPVAPVMDMTYRYTPATVAGAAGDATDGARLLRLIRTTVPVGLLIGGFALLVIGVGIVAFRRRGDETPAGPTVIDLTAAERETADSNIDQLLSAQDHETPTP